MKLSFLSHLIIVSIFITGCFKLSCGLFGATTTYDTKLIIDRPFESLSVSVGDTLIFRPEQFVHVEFYYTGSPNCDDSDYKDAPYFYPVVENDSLATAKAFYEGESKWQGSERKIRIIGLETGSTYLNLRTEWYEQGTTDDIIREQYFDIELLITE